ncbi:hypothetical protein [Lacinutrix cladophorae]
MKLEFSNIKESYLDIKTFLENASGQKINGLNTRIAEDLGLFGDDNYFLLTEFAEKYNVDFQSFEYDKHFESEGELFNSFRTLISILSLPFFLIAKIIKFIFPRISIDLTNLTVSKARETYDLTFGDLIVSKLKGEFCLRKNTLIEI